MPFKIVQTEENKKTVLTVVPSKWERNGVLFWPRQKNEVKLIHDAESLPKPDWNMLKCIKKREYSTLHEAERELEIMEQASDTDAENIHLTSRSKQKSRMLHNTRVLQPIDLNDDIVMCQNTTIANVQASPCEYDDPVQIDNAPIVITVSSDEALQQLLPSTSIHNIENANYNSPPVTSLGSNCSKSSSNASEPNAVLSYVGLSETQFCAQVIENQQKIMSQLSVLQASVDFLMRKKIHASPTEQPTTSTNRLSIQPLNSKNDFDQLESKLKDETFYTKLVAELTFICGNSGKCRGLDSCYKLVDYFFTRHIFLQCNWTGSTRDANAEKKIPFKFYTKIRSCFLDIIRKSDVNFTENEADKFFKVIIKNAKPRLQNKVNSVARASKPRVKNHNAEQLQGNGNTDDTNDASPPSQHEPNEEAVDIPTGECEADNLNGEGNQREVVQNNETN